MLRPKKTIPKLTVAALALTGCSNDEPPVCGVNQGLTSSSDVPPIVATFCMNVVDCYADEYPYYTVDDCIYNASCFFGRYAIPIACPELVSYFECAAELTCEEIMAGDFCPEEFDEIVNCLPPG